MWRFVENILKEVLLGVSSQSSVFVGCKGQQRVVPMQNVQMTRVYPKINKILEIHFYTDIRVASPQRKTVKGRGKGHPCTSTEALYRPYGP
jgi:hypothetical protein